MSSSTILIICGFNMWVLSQIIHEIITDIICHSDFFLESVRSTKLVLWLQVMNWVLEYFTLAPHLIFFLLTFGKKCEKNYFKMNSIYKENYSPEIVQY